ncbi:MAG: UDP-N-acetylmuramoyl-tripeptide--D-alanyl-D-alanine ligase, partial [bacterium]|nr:UDP-N-acetylmuramoyl-tripeptide--D-alanyl-D-alanine ligase [bacterium]
QQKYWEEAKEKLDTHQPFIIGITGSFGKTSVKHILGHILQMTAPTLWTPGSVNTAMGITRIVRERLTDKHKYFIVEMGAYGPGSISKLCKLTPPDMGLITAIGPAHYERFKTLETVTEAKFELAHNVIKKNKSGPVIVSNAILKFPAAEGFATLHPENLIVCGSEDTCALLVHSIDQTPKGLDVRLTWEKKKYTLKAPLFGLHHGENIALAFAAACRLGVDPETIITALKSLPQIAHRLEVKPQPNGSVLIDDAFNSNPAGFKSALTLLDTLGKHHGGKRILVTPGMVELGKSHDGEHEKISKQALKTTDIVLAISPKRIKRFVNTYEKGMSKKQEIVICKTFADAQKWMAENVSAGDVVLLENDLPDLYESVPSL